jgi:hypothetical protein
VRQAWLVMAVTGRPAVERRPSVALEQHRDALAAADAAGNQPELVVLAFHLAQDLGGEDRAGGGDRVAEGDRSAVWVDLRGVEVEDRQRFGRRTPR